MTTYHFTPDLVLYVNKAAIPEVKVNIRKNESLDVWLSFDRYQSGKQFLFYLDSLGSRFTYPELEVKEVALYLDEDNDEVGLTRSQLEHINGVINETVTKFQKDKEAKRLAELDKQHLTGLKYEPYRVELKDGVVELHRFYFELDGDKVVMYSNEPDGQAAVDELKQQSYELSARNAKLLRDFIDFVVGNF